MYIAIGTLFTLFGLLKGVKWYKGRKDYSTFRYFAKKAEESWRVKERRKY